MSAPDEKRRGKTAEELLAQLLTGPEQRAVLTYSRDHGLESDDAVLFLVALLKVYAFAHDRILRTIEESEKGLRHIEIATDAAIRRIDKALADRTIAIETVMQQATGRMALHTAELHAETGTMRAVKDEIDKTGKEAADVYRAYKRLADDGSGSTLSQLFQKATREVLDRYIPIFNMDTRDSIFQTVAQATRNLRLMWVVHFVADLAFMLLVLLIIRR